MSKSQIAREQAMEVGLWLEKLSRGQKEAERLICGGC